MAMVGANFGDIVHTINTWTGLIRARARDIKSKYPNDVELQSIAESEQSLIVKK